ncbi:uncharacterized protein [Euphorbia lathyris]|uniref:uncharacterized protein n=1 Tax=Euphorbia lathyris TaxID=212925 RepID=UPI003313DA4A
MAKRRNSEIENCWTTNNNKKARHSFISNCDIGLKSLIQIDNDNRTPYTYNPRIISGLPKPQHGRRSRTPPATPYGGGGGGGLPATPSQNQNQAHGGAAGGLLSKLLDPALRLAYSGANLLFGSFFSKSQSSTNLNHGGSFSPQLAPLVDAVMQDDIGSSPIEIARAYMAHRTSGVGFGTTSSMSRDSNELVGKPSQALRSTLRWPGALVQDQHGYMIPQTQRKRFGFHNFPRTPYSRTNHSTTKFRLIQLQGNHGTHPSIMTNPFEQTTTPLKQVHSKTNAIKAYQRYVGPIHRLRHKFNVETPAGGSVNFNGAKSGYWCNLEGLSSAPKQNVENGRIDSQCTKPQNTELFSLGVPAQSSRMARKILEHLDRKPPTRIDKSAMLRIASSWKKQQQEPGNKVNAVATIRYGYFCCNLGI